MSVFCVQCGAKIREDAVFCNKCGARQPVAGNAPTQPTQPQAPQQPQMQAPQQQAPRQQAPQQQAPQQQAPQPQPRMQQPQQGYAPQQQMQQPQQGYMQQPQQPRYGYAQQPQMQQQMQPQMQQQYAQPQYAQMQQPYAQVPPKKKSKAGLVVGLIIGGVALMAGAVFLLITLMKDNRTKFSENVVGVSENFSAEFPNIGLNIVDMILPLYQDDTKDSHTTTYTSTFESESLGDKQVEMIQTHSYDNSSGAASYTFGINVDDMAVGESGIYFDGDEFIYSPMDLSSPMVRYELSKEQAKGLQSYTAVDRFALMMLDRDSEKKANWDAAVDNFMELALQDVENDEFEKGSEKFMIFGKEKSCDTLSLTVSGEKARNLLKGIRKLMTLEMSGDKIKDDLNLFGDKIEGEEGDEKDVELTLTTFSYSGKPVGMRLSGMADDQEYEMIISCYRSGEERQFIVSTSDEKSNTVTYEDSVISEGGKYRVTTRLDYGEAYLLIEETGKISGADHDLSGTITVDPGTEGGKGVPVVGQGITGTISHYMKGGEGEIVTTLDMEKNSVTIHTQIEKGRLDDDKITAPPFIDESGTDCADLEELQTVLGQTKSLELLESKNSVARLLDVLMVVSQGKGSMVSDMLR